MRYVELYLRMNFRGCLHVEISSLRLFSIAMCGLVIRKNSLVLQRLRHFIRFVYGFAFAMIFRATMNSFFSSFSFHRCLLSSVLFLLFTCISHPVDVLFSYSCMFSSLRPAAAVLFLCSAILLCCGHLSIAWRWACSCSWVSGCCDWIFSSACGP